MVSLFFRIHPQLAYAMPCLLSALCLGWSGIGRADAPMYRWVDENGDVHYTDQVPPDQIGQGHIRLNEGGLRLETLPPVPTEEELRQVEEEGRLREDEARRIEQQRADDRRLLKSFRSIEDLTLARDGKLATVDALIQVKRDGVRFELERLLALHEESKGLKRSGQQESVNPRNGIVASELRIRDGYASILDLEFKKEEIRHDFDQIMARFRRLRNLPEPVDERRELEADESGPLLPYLVSCNGIEQCSQYWERALAYIRTHVDRGDEVLGAGLLIAFQRDEREDRRLTLAWVQKTPEQPVYLYLDLECRNRLTASLVCINQAALDVRDGFWAAVTQRSGAVVTRQ